MLKRVSTLIEYISYLYKYNLELQKTTKSIFRVIKKERKNGKNVIDVQVINKASVFRCRVDEIIGHDQLLECFSKSDIKLITYLATEDLFQPRNKIVGFEYKECFERTVLRVKTKDNQYDNFTPDQISSNPELLNGLSQEDAHRAGYLLAIEQMILEKKSMENIKNSK